MAWLENRGENRQTNSGREGACTQPCLTSYFSMVMLFLFACQPAYPAPQASSEESNPARETRPLTIALSGLNTVPPSTQEPIVQISTTADVLGRIVSARPRWYQWVAVSAPHDVFVTIEKYAEGTSEGWRLSLTSKFPVPKTRSFPALEAVEPFLSTDLLRLYVINNLSSLQEKGIRVKATLIGDNKPVYSAGDRLSFNVEAPVDGYLYLVNVNPEGAISLLFPQSGESNYLHARESVELPRKGTIFTVKEPFGEEYVKAIFTRVPIDLSVVSGNQATPADIITRAPHGPDAGTADVYFRTTKSRD